MNPPGMLRQSPRLFPGSRVTRTALGLSRCTCLTVMYAGVPMGELTMEQKIRKQVQTTAVNDARATIGVHERGFKDDGGRPTIPTGQASSCACP